MPTCRQRHRRTKRRQPLADRLDALVIAAIDDQAATRNQRRERLMRPHLQFVLGLDKAQQHRSKRPSGRIARRDTIMRNAPIPGLDGEPTFRKHLRQRGTRIDQQHPRAPRETKLIRIDQCIGRTVGIVAPKSEIS